ncbi:hypothetical protein [Kordiimonas lipolytica]|nr:hypothetical protein [Kordiimonas lipolytica]
MACLIALNGVAAAADDYLVTQYRAAPGKLPELLKQIKETDWDEVEGTRPIIMRHSQGDQWDLMLLAPYGDSCTSEKCAKFKSLWSTLLRASTRLLVDYELRFLATSETPWSKIQAMNSGTGLYHIEMFNAAAGKHDALLSQRRRENEYLAKTGQVTNVIFTVTMGSDVDAFTIGFHESLKTFAESPDLPTEAFEQAAVEAGFKNRADISFHLRELIVGHHDTLATKVK